MPGRLRSSSPEVRGASWISASDVIELVVIDVFSRLVPRATAVTTMSSCGTSAAGAAAAGAAGAAAGSACGSAACAEATPANAVANEAAAMPASKT
jgi:hypothetical protein